MHRSRRRESAEKASAIPRTDAAQLEVGCPCGKIQYDALGTSLCLGAFSLALLARKIASGDFVEPATCPLGGARF